MRFLKAIYEEAGIFLSISFAGDPAKSMLWFATISPCEQASLIIQSLLSRVLIKRHLPCTLWLMPSYLATMASTALVNLRTPWQWSCPTGLESGSPMAGESCLEKWQRAPSTDPTQQCPLPGDPLTAGLPAPAKEAIAGDPILPVTVQKSSW